GGWGRRRGGAQSKDVDFPAGIWRQPQLLECRWEEFRERVEGEVFLFKDGIVGSRFRACWSAGAEPCHKIGEIGRHGRLTGVREVAFERLGALHEQALAELVGITGVERVF